MEFELGIVCGRCDWYSAMGVASCTSCGSVLALEAPPPSRAPVTEPPTSLFGQDQLKPRKPPSSTSIAAAPMARPISAVRAQGGESAVSSSGAFDDHVSAHLPVGRAYGVGAVSGGADGSSQELRLPVVLDAGAHGAQVLRTVRRRRAAGDPERAHAVLRPAPDPRQGEADPHPRRGRRGPQLPAQRRAARRRAQRPARLPGRSVRLAQHANLFYRDGKLVVRDEGSLNGVFLRVRGTVDVGAGDHFLAGEQLFRVEAPAEGQRRPRARRHLLLLVAEAPSPVPRSRRSSRAARRAWPCCARGQSLQIGREGGDLNFPDDLYMSASHCKLEEHGGKFTLTDLNSRNGTYVRLKAERELAPRRLPLHRPQAPARRDHRELAHCGERERLALRSAGAREVERLAQDHDDGVERDARQAHDDGFEVQRPVHRRQSISNSSAKRSYVPPRPSSLRRSAVASGRCASPRISRARARARACRRRRAAAARCTRR